MIPGGPILVALGARLFQFDGQSIQEIAVSSPTSSTDYTITRIVWDRHGQAFLLLADLESPRGFLMRYDRSLQLKRVLDVPTDQRFMGIAIDDRNDVLFVATGDTVYRRNSRGGWSNASWGLPTNPLCAQLQYAFEPDGTTALYLSTGGRSVWRAELERWRPPDPPTLVSVVDSLPHVR